MKNRAIIYIITIFFIISVAIIGYSQIKTMEFTPFYFEVVMEETTEKVEYWENAEGNLYVFLPSYTSMQDVYINLETSKDVILGESLLADGMSCEGFALNQWYELSYGNRGGEEKHQLMFVQSANVATMYIQTRSGDMDYIYRKKGNEEAGNMILYNVDGSVDYEGDMNSLKGRGNSTWTQFEKKPFAMKLESEADLLGMGAAEKWILLANADDPSNMRNKMIYDYADAIGMPYSPESRWVDLYLNGEYSGLYLLCERIEIHEERLDISEPDNSGNGSYIVSMELASRMEEAEAPFVVTAMGQPLRINEPSKVSEELQNNIRMQWQSIENALLAEDGIDPATGKYYTDMIDLDSWVDKYLVEEIFASVDACYLSQYFYSEGTGTEDVIYAGPVWDYDHAVAREEFLEPNALVANRQFVKVGVYTPWFYNLYQKEEFYNRLREVYADRHLEQIEVLVNEMIPSYAEEIRTASDMNQIRWFASSGETMDSEVIVMTDFLTERKEFLADVWLNGEEYHTVSVDSGLGGVFLYYAVKPGECMKELPDLPEFDTMYFTGWYDKTTDLPFDITQPVTKDLDIYAKWENISGE